MRLSVFDDTATTEISTLSLHDALPICRRGPPRVGRSRRRLPRVGARTRTSASASRYLLNRPLRAIHLRPPAGCLRRSEEHTSELQSRQYLVCRLLLEKKKTRHPALHVD